MSAENNPFFLMGAMLGEKSGEVNDLRRRIEELQAKLAKQDDLVQAAVAAERERNAKVADSYNQDPYPQTERIAAAIREGGE